MANRYKIIRELGKGGMGEVYKAHDERLDRDVAIKVLRQELASDPQRLRRFEQEARSASALNHTNIIHIYDIGKHGATRYIAMEFVEGQTLREILSEGPLPTKELLQLSTQIAEGLAKAHGAGIIHRDLKPENLMVTSDGYVKILDFGLAKLLPQAGVDSEAATMTKEGTVAGAVMGTARYMSPEQALGEPLDARTDVFSLGAVLYEMATGRRPFQGDTPAALFNEILNKTPESPVDLNPELPKELERITNRALEKEREARYPSARELLVELKAVRPEADASGPSLERSIVVLPFENMSPDPEQEYFCDGMTEEIIADLSKIQSLRVISRTSSMRLKGTDKDIGTIGKELKVQWVLEGSVRKAGNNLRITAQLIDATNDAHLWAEKYSGTLEDVFDIQEEVAHAIVNELELKLAPEEKRRIGKRKIDDPKAYECYLHAQQEIYRLTETSLDRAQELIRNGLDLIGENELLYATLGNIYFQLHNVTTRLDETHLQKADQYTSMAFALNPHSSYAMSLRGLIAYKHADINSAVRWLKRALDEDPHNTDALFWLVYLYAHAGRSLAARPLVERLIRLDPLVPINHGLAGLTELMGGKFEDALPHFRRWHEMELHPFSLWAYAYVLVHNGRHEEANRLFDRLPCSDPPSVWDGLGLAMKYGLRGDAAAVQAVITPELKSLINTHEQFSWMAARFCALAGMKRESLSYLENAIALGFINYPFISEVDPFLENIRGEPRFKKLMKRVKHEWENFEV